MRRRNDDQVDPTRRSGRWQLAVVVEGVVLVLALAAVAGCRSGEGSPAPGAHARAIVVAHHANELAPLLGSPDLDRLRVAAADPASDDAVASVVVARRPEVETIDLEPRRRNGRIERDPRIAALVEDRLAELQPGLA